MPYWRIDSMLPPTSPFEFIEANKSWAEMVRRRSNLIKTVTPTGREQTKRLSAVGKRWRQDRYCRRQKKKVFGPTSGLRAPLV